MLVQIVETFKFFESVAFIINGILPTYFGKFLILLIIPTQYETNSISTISMLRSFKLCNEFP